ncbi:E3 ubiquitin-protein ligase [Trichinella spiralis]|uniref:E3 ubiquitin-protein ligase n=1 Tax=Trichinella spiralis TaxID=6334 RepID=A0ABR3K3D5_TRISP
MRRRLFCQSALRIKSRTIIDGHVENDQDVVNSTKDNQRVQFYSLISSIIEANLQISSVDASMGNCVSY